MTRNIKRYASCCMGTARQLLLRLQSRSGSLGVWKVEERVTRSTPRYVQLFRNSPSSGWVSTWGWKQPLDRTAESGPNVYVSESFSARRSTPDCRCCPDKILAYVSPFSIPRLGTTARMPGRLSYRHSEENRRIAIDYMRATLDHVSAIGRGTCIEKVSKLLAWE